MTNNILLPGLYVMFSCFAAELQVVQGGYGFCFTVRIYFFVARSMC